jgi:DNA polymerase III epsilon subunit-like protein
MTNITQFLKSVTVLDTETTNMDPKLCEIVEVASATWDDNWYAESSLLGSYEEIPWAASAKNNISRKMIANMPKFDQSIDYVKNILNWDTSKYFCAHNAKYDRQALKTSFEKINSITDIEQCENLNKWICTWRLSKQILINEFNDVQFGLSYLRYRLDLDISDNIGVHRAGDDTLVCAKLLEKLIEIGIKNGTLNVNTDLGPQLVELSWKFIPIKIWPIGGKHKGELLTNLTNDYYTWALKTLDQLREGSSNYDEDLTESIRLVLSDRLENI